MEEILITKLKDIIEYFLQYSELVLWNNKICNAQMCLTGLKHKPTETNNFILRKQQNFICGMYTQGGNVLAALLFQKDQLE